MKLAELLADRQLQWLQLDQLCGRLERRELRKLTAADLSRFAALYRAACADLALADAYRLPPNTTEFLHQLVGRAHNQLYRSRTFDYANWGKRLWHDVPRRIFSDGCVQVAFALFWTLFALSALLAASPDLWPEYVTEIMSAQEIERLESSFSQSITGRRATINPSMAAFYIYHNTGIGLKCFAGGLLVLPGLLMTAFNAIVLGGSFGYMARPEVTSGPNFYHFVTAHGPFELTAIVLSAGAGLRLGLGWVKTNGLTRIDSMRSTIGDAMPIMATAMILFLMAAIIEAFVSPSAAPYGLKATIAVISSGLLMFYIVVLGFPYEELRAPAAADGSGPSFWDQS